MSYLMILGAGTMQIPAILTAKELGLKVLVADGSPDAVAIKMCEEFVHIDLKDYERLAQYAQEFQKSHSLVGIFTAGTDFSASVAYIAQACGLPGHSYEATQRATNKLLMRQCFLEHGIASPRFVAISSSTETGSLMSTLRSWDADQFPKVVIKPIDNMGARGVIFIEKEELIEDAIKHALVHSPSGGALIEEFMEGPELSIDALVFDGQIIPYGIADRHIFYPPYFIEMGHTLPSVQPETTLKEVVDVFSAAVRAIGLTHGAAKGDIKVTKQGVKIGEIAARLSGGYMSGWTYPHASGINLTKNAIQLAIGQTSQIQAPAQNLKVSAEWSFISIPGVVAEIYYADEAQKIPYVVESFLRIQKGSIVQFPENNVQKCGNFIACHADREIAQHAVFSAVKTIFLRLEPGHEATQNFLYEEDWPSSAWIDGHDFNHLNAQEVKQQFERITKSGWQDCITFNEKQFTIAVERGSLQGAVWFYDTYVKRNSL